MKLLIIKWWIGDFYSQLEADKKLLMIKKKIS